MSEIDLGSDLLILSCFFDGHLDIDFNCWGAYLNKIGYPDWTREDEAYNRCSKFGFMEFVFV